MRPAGLASSRDVRDRLAEALRLDLVGPTPGHRLEHERLPGHVRPSAWYLTGFLVPSGAAQDAARDADEDDDFDVVPDEAGLPEESAEERRPAKRGRLPSSMGLSFLVPPQGQVLTVEVRWADYVPGPSGGEEAGSRPAPSSDGREAAGEGRARGGADGDGARASGGSPGTVWQRVPRNASLRVALDGWGDPTHRCPVPDSGGLHLTFVQRVLHDAGLEGRVPEGTRSVSVFLVNDRPARAEDVPDLAFAFQAEIEVVHDGGFVGRPDLRGARSDHGDDRVADLHYADAPSFATGHGVSADWAVVDGACRRVFTAWIPEGTVEKTVPHAVEGATLSMDSLGALSDGQAVRAALAEVPASYRRWIESERRRASAVAPRHKETAAGLLRDAEQAARRIEQGVEVLATDPEALDAFRLANRAVAAALRRRRDTRDPPPQWYPFQLAFLLLNVAAMVDPGDPHRETVDLLFFPTGGGKTEAYLGLAAFAMVLRRLRPPGLDGHPAVPLLGAGVSVIMRYTLRLLTLDQLSRAAALVCALELERSEAPQRYGAWPFEIGLWVGKGATPNHMGRRGDGRADTARTKVRQYRADPRGKPSPIPLEACPWCDTAFDAESFHLAPDDDAPRDLRIVCANPSCAFTRDRPLPVVAVDEPLYRRLPAFLIATVDKFASLPWVGGSGLLLGGAQRHDAHGFYGPTDPGRGERLASPLPPPDLIIQDELHLIAGPLGTMTGLYETAIDALTTRPPRAGRPGEAPGTSRPIRPKIVASTATVRRARDHVQALFARPDTKVFPPPGPRRGDSFFARTAPAAERPPRLYLGIAAPGRNPKVVMRKVWVPLMAAAHRAYVEAGGAKNPDNPADPYMTVLGYFNSLRELGGARRILEEEVQNTIKGYGARLRVGEKVGLFRDRKRFSDIVELTSRVETHKVAAARRALASRFPSGDRPVDCALATNMISVGLDVPRLGMMVVLGQPKTHAEYIQATSRVGRDDARPGLVLTLLNVHKPRDRSHYEHFRSYHETFYRAVEVGSVTPFAARALDRGLAGAVVALARHVDPAMTPPRGAEQVAARRAALEARLLDAFRARLDAQPIDDPLEREERTRSVEVRVGALLDGWVDLVEDRRADGVQTQYQRYEESVPKPLLKEILDGGDDDPERDDARRPRAGRSLRDVEPEVNLFLRDLEGRRRAPPARGASPTASSAPPGLASEGPA